MNKYFSNVTLFLISLMLLTSASPVFSANSDGKEAPRAVFLLCHQNPLSTLREFESQLSTQLQMHSERLLVTERLLNHELEESQMMGNSRELFIRIMTEEAAEVLVYLETIGEDRVILKLVTADDTHSHTWAIRTALEPGAAGGLALAAKEALEDTVLFNTWRSVYPEINDIEEMIPASQIPPCEPEIVEVERLVETVVEAEPGPWSLTLGGSVRFGVAGGEGPSTVGGPLLDLSRDLAKRWRVGLGMASLFGPNKELTDGVLWGFRLEPSLFVAYGFQLNRVVLEPQLRGVLLWAKEYAVFGGGDNQDFSWWNGRLDLAFAIGVAVNSRFVVEVIPSLGVYFKRQWFHRESNDEVVLRTPLLEMGVSLGLKWSI